MRFSAWRGARGEDGKFQFGVATRGKENAPVHWFPRPSLFKDNRHFMRENSTGGEDWRRGVSMRIKVLTSQSSDRTVAIGLYIFLRVTWRRPSVHEMNRGCTCIVPFNYAHENNRDQLRVTNTLVIGPRRSLHTSREVHLARTIRLVRQDGIYACRPCRKSSMSLQK